MQPANENVDRLARIVDNRSASRNQDVGLPLRDLAQALNDVARAGGPAMVTIFLDLRNRVLQAEQVEDSTVSIDQVANAGDSLAIDFNQVRYRAPRVPRGFDHLNREILPDNRIAVTDGPGEQDRIRENAAGLIGVIVEAGSAVAFPKLRDIGEQG